MGTHAHPVCYAMSVARAIGQMSGDAATDGRMPPAMSSVIASAAADATLTLGLFATTQRHALPRRVASAIESARSDLETLMQLAELASYCSEAPRNATHVARAMRELANLTALHLKRASDGLP